MKMDIGDAMISVKHGLKVSRPTWEDGEYIQMKANEVMAYRDFCWGLWHPDTDDLLASDYYIKED